MSSRHRPLNGADSEDLDLRCEHPYCGDTVTIDPATYTPGSRTYCPDHVGFGLGVEDVHGRPIEPEDLVPATSEELIDLAHRANALWTRVEDSRSEALAQLRRHEREGFAELLIAYRLVPDVWKDEVRAYAANPERPRPDRAPGVGFRSDPWKGHFPPRDDRDGGHSER